MKIDLYLKPRYGFTIGLHLHRWGTPLQWRPLVTRAGAFRSFSWLDITLAIARHELTGL